MSRATEAVEALGSLAADQWGLITTAQAHEVGTRTQQLTRLTEAGVLERLRHGVYRVTGAPAGPHDELRAAWLAFCPSKTAAQRLANPDVEVVSHRSAALLHHLGDLDAEYLEFTTPTRKQTRDPRLRIHRGQLARRGWTVVGGLPVTTVAATIRDLAAARIDGGHLAGVIRDAVTTHHLGVAEVADVLSPYAHHYGSPLGQGAVLLQRMLEQAGVPESTHAAGQLVGWSAPSDPTRRVLDSVAAMSTLPPIDPGLSSIHQEALRAHIALIEALRGIDTVGLDSIQQALEANTSAIAAARAAGFGTATTRPKAGPDPADHQRPPSEECEGR